VEGLLKLSRRELLRVALEHHVRTTGNKLDVATRIVSLCNPPAAQRDRQNSVLQAAPTAIHTSTPPHHMLYREHFNGVDLHDRYWYRFSFCFRCNNWRTKMLLSLFGSAVVNAWVLGCEDTNLDLALFRIGLTEKLLS
jgi:hypothetical protein